MLRELLRDGRWRRVFLAGAIVALAGGLYAVRAVLPPFFVALLLTYALAPAVERLERGGLGRSPAILLVYALSFLGVGAVLAFAAPLFVDEVRELVRAVPAYLARLETGLRILEARYDRVPLPGMVRTLLDTHISRLSTQAAALAGSAMDGFLGLSRWFVSLGLAPILAYYLLLDLPRFRQQFEGFWASRSRSFVRGFLGEADRIVAGFIRGQVAVAALVGALTAAALGLLGIPYFVVLGLVAGVMDLIPYFGPFLGALPGLAVASLISWPLALKATFAYVLVQQIESAVLMPRLVGGSVGLHPLAIVFALLVGGHYLGMGGMLVAVPVAALMRSAARHLLRWLTES